MERSTATSSPFDSLVRVVTGHLVSSNSMVSRAYLTDSWRAIVVTLDDGDLWLAATLDALGPDVDRLLDRGQREGGPPRDQASVRLAKISVSWGGTVGRPGIGGDVDIANPIVVKHPDGAPIGVLSLTNVRGLDSDDDGVSGPVPFALFSSGPNSGSANQEDEVEVLTLFAHGEGAFWPIARRAHRVTQPRVDFLDQPGAVGIGVSLGSSESGSPVFSLNPSARVFLGLARPVGDDVAMLLPPSLIVETILHAIADD